MKVITSTILIMLSTSVLAEEVRVFLSWPSANYRPFYSWSEEKRTFEGIDPDVISLVMRDLKLEFKYVFPEFESSHPRVDVLRRNLADLCIRCFSITQARKEKIDFSIPYYEDGLTVMTRKGSQVTKLEDLKGKKLLAYLNTTGYVFATKKKLTKKIVSEVSGEYFRRPHAMLTDGLVDALINDKSRLDWLAKQDRTLVVWEQRFTKEPWGIGVKKGNKDLLAKINVTLAKRLADGSIKRIFEKHGIKWNKVGVGDAKRKDPENERAEAKEGAE